MLEIEDATPGVCIVPEVGGGLAGFDSDADAAQPIPLMRSCELINAVHLPGGVLAHRMTMPPPQATLRIGSFPRVRFVTRWSGSNPVTNASVCQRDGGCSCANRGPN